MDEIFWGSHGLDKLDEIMQEINNNWNGLMVNFLVFAKIFKCFIESNSFGWPYVKFIRIYAVITEFSKNAENFKDTETFTLILFTENIFKNRM